MDFAAELAIGKPNSLGNTLNVVKAVESNPKLFSQLLKLLLHEDSIVAMRAMNATKRLISKVAKDLQKDLRKAVSFKAKKVLLSL
jgi:hypothetical protein